MKAIISTLLLLMCFGYPNAQDVIGTKYSYTHLLNDYEFYLHTAFSKGSGSICPNLKWSIVATSNDTVFIKAIYDLRGHWPSSFCDRHDTVKYTNTHTGINYFNVSTNYITVSGMEPTEVDTFWNLYDTTFNLSVSGIIEQKAQDLFSLYPNPGNGTMIISAAVIPTETLSVKVYDLFGRIVHQENLSFKNNDACLVLKIPNAFYILELRDEKENIQRERILIQ
jgi:hypothetical protein